MKKTASQTTGGGGLFKCATESCLWAEILCVGVHGLLGRQRKKERGRAGYQGLSVVNPFFEFWDERLFYSVSPRNL